MEKTTSTQRYSTLSEYKDWAIAKFRAPHITESGFFVGFLHDSCLPWRDRSTPEGQEWYKEARKGYTSENDWRREHEIDFQAHVGTPIFTHFNDKDHTKEGLQVLRDLPIIRGWDPGTRFAACVWLQIKDPGKGTPQVRIFREDVTVGTDFDELAKRVQEVAERDYAAWRGQIWDFIDIAGKTAGPTSKRTAVDVLGTYGIAARYRKSGPEERILEINHLLTHKTTEGQQCFRLDPIGCPRVYVAMRGLYRRKEGSVTIEDNDARHPIDAAGYAIDNNLWLRFQKKEEPPKPRLKAATDWLTTVIEGKRKGKNWLEC